MAVGQSSAIDPGDLDVSGQLAFMREVRLRELWRWLLTQKIGREFLWEVMLADVGYDRPLNGLHDPQATVLIEQAGLRNLALRWMNERVRRQPEQFRQMLAEASKREDEEREAELALRAKAREKERTES